VRRVAAPHEANGAETPAPGASTLRPASDWVRRRSLELIGPNGRTEGANPLFVRVVAEYDRVKQDLNAL
jgi:hypothetical protein